MLLTRNEKSNNIKHDFELFPNMVLKFEIMNKSWSSC